METLLRKVEMLILLTTLLSVVAAECPDGQLWHAEKSACCVPIYDCNVDSEVKLCTKNGGADQCVSCGNDRTNGYMSSSLNYKHRCFDKKKQHNDCPLGDTVPIPTYKEEKCALPCRCRHEDCYYGDPCSCRASAKCGINEELKPDTGECQPCAEGKYKSTTGCGPCVTNVTHFWLTRPELKTYEVINVTEANGNFGIIEIDESPEDNEPGSEKNSGKESEDSPAPDKDSGGISMVAVVIVILVLVSLGICIAVVLVVLRRQLKSGDSNSRLVVCYYKLTGTPLPVQNDEVQRDQYPHITQIMARDVKQGKTSADNGYVIPRIPIIATAERFSKSIVTCEMTMIVEAGISEAGLSAQPANATVPVQEVTPMVQPGGIQAEEPRLDTLKSVEPEPEASEDVNITTTPLIGGTTREDDETEQKTKE